MFEDVAEFEPAEGEKELHYFYNRQERLEKASQPVRDFYDGKMKPVRGIRVFWLKQNRYIFLALIFFVAVTWIYSGMNKSRAWAKINGVNCEVKAFSYREEVYVSLEMKRLKSKKVFNRVIVFKSKNNSEKYLETDSPLPVTAVIRYIEPNGQVVEEQTLSCVFPDKSKIDEKGRQFLRAKYRDYDIIRVDLMIGVGGISDGAFEEKELSAEVKR